VVKKSRRRPIENDPEVDEVPETPPETPKEFVKEMFGEEALAVPQPELPSMEWIKENYKTKSAAIRYLVHLGFNVNIISKHLGIKYQHVRNVATSPLKRGPNEDWRPKEERKPVPIILPPKKGVDTI
jgi:hypothetical protein